MRKLAPLISIVLAAGVWFAYTHVERYENSYILVTAKHVYDPLGHIKDLFNRLSRDCSHVIVVAPLSQDWLAIRKELSHLKELYETEATPLRIMQEGTWFLAKAEFAALEPAIFALNYEGHTLQVRTNGVWSGAAGPWVPGPLIREYIQSHVPSVPHSLVQCFEPTLEHFKS